MSPSSVALDSLVAQCAGLARAPGRSLLAIVGPPGSGKSTLAAHIIAALTAQGLGAAVRPAPMDGFHLSNAELARLGLSDRKGALDTFDAAGYLALLRRLVARDEPVVYAPEFDRTLEEPIAGSIAIESGVALIVCEGNYLLVPEGPWADLAALFDVSCYCDVPDDIRLPRLIERHHRFGKNVDAARAWAMGSDQRNADVVAATRSRAQLTYRSASTTAS
jgi:pantothenate kinase